MGEIKPPPTGILFFGFLYSKGINIEEVHSRICGEFGDAIAKSDVWPWEFSTHYEHEMGTGLRRQLIAIDGEFDVSRLAEVKRRSNEIEMELATEGQRRVNIDPGYLTLEHVALASTKRQAHRLLIGEGIFAEVTLIYHRKTGYDPLPWTYPDYQTSEIREWLNGLRRQFVRS